MTGDRICWACAIGSCTICCRTDTPPSLHARPYDIRPCGCTCERAREAQADRAAWDARWLPWKVSRGRARRGLPALPGYPRYDL